MDICVLTSSTTVHQMGGTEVHAETLAKAAAAEGHRVTLVTSAHPHGVTSERRDGYETFYLPGTHFSMSREWLAPWWGKSSEKLRELAAAGRLDAVWAENLTGQYYAALPGRKPLLSIINGPAIRGELLNRWAQVASPSDLLYFFTRGLGQVFFHLRPWFARAAANSDLLVCVSDYCEAELLREFKSSRGKTITIYNPADTSLFFPDPELRARARAEYGLPPEAPVLAMSGVLSRQKGMHVGLEAFREIKAATPAARLLIAGDGPELEPLRRLSRQLGLAESVLFLGRIENAAMNFFYNAADIYLNPTLRREGLAIVILEAMACGLPCVVSEAGGTTSTIEEGKSGFFTRPGSARDISAKAALLLNDPALRAAMGRSARTRALKDFGLKTIIGRYLDATEKVLRERRP